MSLFNIQNNAKNVAMKQNNQSFFEDIFDYDETDMECFKPTRKETIKQNLNTSLDIKPILDKIVFNYFHDDETKNGMYIFGNKHKKIKTRLPQMILMMIDVSGSMSKYYNDFANGMDKFVDNFHEEDMLCVCLFGTKIYQLFPFLYITIDNKQFIKDLTREHITKGLNSTNTYLALKRMIEIIEQIKPMSNNKIVSTYLLTDGDFNGDNPKTYYSNLCKISGIKRFFYTFGNSVSKDVMISYISPDDTYKQQNEANEFFCEISNSTSENDLIIADDIKIFINGKEEKNLGYLNISGQRRSPFRINNMENFEIYATYIIPNGEKIKISGTQDKNLEDDINPYCSAKSAEYAIDTIHEQIDDFVKRANGGTKNILELFKKIGNIRDNFNTITEDIARKLNTEFYGFSKSELKQYYDATKIIIEDFFNKAQHDKLNYENNIRMNNTISYTAMGNNAASSVINAKADKKGEYTEFNEENNKEGNKKKKEKVPLPLDNYFSMEYDDVSKDENDIYIKINLYIQNIIRICIISEEEKKYKQEDISLFIRFLNFLTDLVNDYDKFHVERMILILNSLKIISNKLLWDIEFKCSFNELDFLMFSSMILTIIEPKIKKSIEVIDLINEKIKNIKLDHEKIEKISTSDIEEKLNHKLITYDSKLLDYDSENTGNHNFISKGKYNGIDVFIKILPTNIMDEEDINTAKQTFYKEALINQGNQFPGCIKFFGVNNSENPTIMVAEQITYTLSELIYDYNIDKSTKIKIITELSMYFKFLLLIGSIHKNIRPENIFFTDLLEVKIGNFDFKKVKLTITSAGTTPKGTHSYIPPELLMHTGGPYIYSEETDIYSFALIINEILTEEKPFYVSVSQIINLMYANDRKRPPLYKSKESDTDDKLREIILKNWDTNPSLRSNFKSLFEMLILL